MHRPWQVQQEQGQKVQLNMQQVARATYAKNKSNRKKKQNGSSSWACWQLGNTSAQLCCCRTKTWREFNQLSQGGKRKWRNETRVNKGSTDVPQSCAGSHLCEDWVVFERSLIAMPGCPQGRAQQSEGGHLFFTLLLTYCLTYASSGRRKAP